MHALFAIRNDFDYLILFACISELTLFMCMDPQGFTNVTDIRPLGWKFCEEYRSSSRTYTSGSRQSKRYITTKIAKAGPKKMAQATKDVLAACLGTKCHCDRHKLGETQVLSLPQMRPCPQATHQRVKDEHSTQRL